MGKTSAIVTEDTDAKSIISTLNRLSPSSLELVAPLVRKLAEREGIVIEATKEPQAFSLTEGIEL